MGAYLSSPVTEKESEDGEGGRLRYGVSAMQGWRRSMEDAHVAVPAVFGDESAAVFGVFDGHGGREVAHFVARHLVEELVRIGEYQEGSYEQALRKAFHRMDEMLRQEEYDAEIKSYKAGSRGRHSAATATAGAASSAQAGGASGAVIAGPGASSGEGSGTAAAAGSGGGGGNASESGGSGSGGGGRLTAQEAIEMLQKILVISNGGTPAQAQQAAAAAAAAQQQQGEKGRDGASPPAPAGGSEPAGFGSVLRHQSPPPQLQIQDDDDEDAQGKEGDDRRRGGGEDGMDDGSGLSLRPVEDPNERFGRREGGGGGDDDEEGDGPLRSPTPFDDTHALKAQGIASPFKGGPRPSEEEEEAEAAAGGSGGSDSSSSDSGREAAAAIAAANEELMRALVVNEGEGASPASSSSSSSDAGAAAAGGAGAAKPPLTEEIVVRGGFTAGEEDEDEEDEEDSTPINTFPLRGGLGGSRMMCALPDHRVQAGCTSVVALLVGNELFVANAGDSRAVLARGGLAVALSEDHKPLQDRELDRIRKAGGFVTEQGRVNGNLNLSRSIGDLKYKGNTTLPPKDQMITAEPDIRRISLVPEDEFLLLACDGVWDVMTNQEAVDFVRERLDQLPPGVPVSSVAEQLLDFCLADDPRKSAGVGGDNFTCLIVQLKDRLGAGGLAPAGSKRQASEGAPTPEGTSKAPRQDVA